MKKIVPNRQELIDSFDDLLKKYPPALLASTNNDNTIKAYKEIIGEYPELMLFQSFSRIYLPQKTAAQIADIILSPDTLNTKKKKSSTTRSRERGLGHSNKILADVELILSHPDELIKRYQCKISKIKFRSLLIIAHRLRENSKSVDHYFNKQQYSDDVRELIAYSLYIIYEAGIMFREELYKAYPGRTKTIKKMPETGDYYLDALKLKVSIKGKQVSTDNIIKDTEDFRTHILGTPYESDRNQRFYKDKRFRYLSCLVIKINAYFQREARKSKKAYSSLRRKTREASRFSIDSYINESINKPRQIYGVLLIDLPALEASVKADFTKDWFF